MNKFEDKLFEFLYQIVQEAGNIAMKHYKVYDMKPDKKEGGPQFSQQVVTDGDLAVQKHFKKEILREFPQLVYFSEETGIIRPKKEFPTIPWVYKVVIDEIDGTANYGRMLPMFSTVVGVQKRRRGTKEPYQTVMGFNYAPALDKFFEARLDKGAKLNKEEIKVSQTNSLDDAFIFDELGWDKEKLSDDYMQFFESMKKTPRQPYNSATAICYIAAGRFDGMTFVSLSPHDWTGPDLILNEAGGNIYLWKRLGRFYHKSRFDLIATNGKIDKPLLEISGKQNEKPYRVLSWKH